MLVKVGVTRTKVSRRDNVKLDLYRESKYMKHNKYTRPHQGEQERARRVFNTFTRPEFKAAGLI